jgi:hypothetical protein
LFFFTDSDLRKRKKERVVSSFIFRQKGDGACLKASSGVVIAFFAKKSRECKSEKRDCFMLPFFSALAGLRWDK